MSEFWDAHDYKKLLDAHYRRYGIDIAVIDDSDFVGFAASATRIDEVYMHDVKSMVANVLKKRVNTRFAASISWTTATTIHSRSATTGSVPRPWRSSSRSCRS